MSSAFVVRQEEDRVRGRRLLLVLAAAAVITAAALGFAAWLLRAAGGASAPAPDAPPAGLVEQTPTPASARGLALRHQQRRELDGWSWVDRDAGIARIPVDVAVRLVIAAEAADASAGAPEAEGAP